MPVSAAGSSGGAGPEQDEITIWCQERAYRLWDWNRLKCSTNGTWHDELPDLENPRQDGYMRMLDNFLAFLAGEPNTMPSFRDALGVQEIVEGILAR